MNILINYADNGFQNAQRRNSESGLKNGFDKVINYCRKDIDSDFLNKNEYILNKVRGAGYWLWKPYIIFKTLENVTEEDIVFYSDCGSVFIKNIQPLLDLVKYEDVILFFDGKSDGQDDSWLNRQWTKRDVFVFMDADTEEYYNSGTMLASFQIYRRSEKSISFIKKYLDLCCHPELITDDDNICDLPNLIGFEDHRHDQSILGIFAKKENINLHKDPTQYGNGSIGLKNDNYAQLIRHDRFRD